MSKHAGRVPFFAVTLTTLGCLTAAMLAAEAPPAPKVSSFAPAEDLIHQVNHYVERTQESLANKDDYPMANQARVQKDANTLAVLGLALALHDNDHKLKGSAAGLIASAQELAAGAKDYAKAAAAFEKVQSAATGKTSDGEKPTEWKKVAGQGQLMKQVQLLYNTLRRGTDKRRFAKQKEENAGMAALLAVIAQSAIIDTHEVKDESQLPEWYKLATEMRDSAAELNSAVHAGNQEGAVAALKRMNVSCETCHKQFRVQVE